MNWDKISRASPDDVVGRAGDQPEGRAMADCRQDAGWHSEDYRCTVAMMTGLPGSGKDTLLATNCADLPLVSLDEVRSELSIEPEPGLRVTPIAICVYDDRCAAAAGGNSRLITSSR
jgi:hypothetical protein